MAVHRFRNSMGYAVKRILFSLVGWLMLGLFPTAALLIACSLAHVGQFEMMFAAFAVVAVLVLVWLFHSKQYWKLLLDRMPQIEVHPTFLRARELGDNDLLLKHILDLRGQQLTAGEVVSSSLGLVVQGQGAIVLDLTELDVSMNELFLLLYEARQGALASPQPADRPPSLLRRSEASLGAQIDRFPPGLLAQIGAGINLAIGLVLILGTLVLGALLAAGSLGVEMAPWLVLLGVSGILVPAVPMTLTALRDFRAVRRGAVFLHREGLVRDTAAVRYSEIWQVDVLTAGDTVVILSLRDGTTLRLSHFKDAPVVARRIKEEIASGGAVGSGISY